MFVKNKININGKYMSYYEAGYGEKTVVFLSGFGTPLGIADMYEMASKLSLSLRVIVLDRFGYGDSDIINNTRNIHNITEEIKYVFNILNIKSENTLIVAHSASCFYALALNKEVPLLGTVLIDMQEESKFKLKITELLYNIYFLLSKTKFKKLFDKSVSKMFYRNIPDEIKYEAIYVQKNKIPNEDIKNELKNIVKELDSFNKYLNSVKEGTFDTSILICRNSTLKYNESIQNKFKNSYILNVGESEHYIHYIYYDLIVDKILQIFC